MASTSGTARRAIAALFLFGALVARADIFSPGELARPHAHLEGLSNCTRCHVEGERLGAEKCLACHVEVKARIDKGEGFHGRMKAADRASCQTCHHEHQGRDYALIDWGAAGRKGFDHARTGFALRGKHAALTCDKCHDARVISDPVVKAMLAKAPPRTETFLGVGTSCTTCHFDEHRGQEGSQCQRCHSESAWKPAAKFDHAKTAYPLEGRHRAVACDKCHPKAEDPAPVRAAFPAPVHAEGFLRFKPVAHAGCIDCHQDPHGGKLGESCAKCHTVEGWMQVKTAGASAARGFHDKTRFPLRGAHESVACRTCHGPWPGERAKFKGTPFARCADCHLDAHLGQLRGLGDCQKCHGIDSFSPPRFTLADHAQTKYPLEGAHAAVACNLCHYKDERLASRVPAAQRREFEKRKRPLLVSLAVFDLPRGTNKCQSCHADVHQGQFEQQVRTTGCVACHRVTSFGDLASFDHARDTRFPLTGKHLSVACAACHRAEEHRGAQVVRYRPLEVTCAGCHADVHAGQFAPSPRGRADCTRCHTTGAWKPVTFQHRPPFTAFELDGKHAGLACASCHKPVTVAAGVTAVRYQPLPTTCEGCHEDFHRGAFKGFEP